MKTWIIDFFHKSSPIVMGYEFVESQLWILDPPLHQACACKLIVYELDIAMQ
jgi:hypothetical protein